MNGHPGGEEHTCRMLALADLPAGASVLDMGAGGGEAVRLLQLMGYSAQGIDLLPRGDGVTLSDFLHTAYLGGHFDAVLSQCAFFVSGDVPGALREAHRILKPGGKLLLSDVFFENPELGFVNNWGLAKFAFVFIILPHVIGKNCDQLINVFVSGSTL